MFSRRAISSTEIRLLGESIICAWLILFCHGVTRRHPRQSLRCPLCGAAICGGVVAGAGKGAALNQVSLLNAYEFSGEASLRSNFADLRGLAFAACSRTISAARSRVAGGTFGSTMIFSTVVAAAPAASCSRPMAWENTVRRASRHAASNSGSSIHRRRVLALTDRAGRILHASVGEQCDNRLLHLLAEFCPVS